MKTSKNRGTYYSPFTLSKIVAALYITGRDSRLKSVIAHPRCLIKKEGGLWHQRRKKRISRGVTSSH